MRFLRLRLANYRGIDQSEVRFGPTGLTIVEGPNEAGKTSLGEAIGVLFDYPDSSKNRIVSAIKPVHRDAGPEIELEAQSGPYVFTYSKRFHKKPQTTLTVRCPKPENHTGREAHERAEAILRETIDIDLWRALGIEQGAAVEQAKLSTQTSLSAALDRTAGGRSTDSREESLFEKVHAEYGRYFTEGGREKKEFQEPQKDQQKAESEVATLEGTLHDLEDDIDRAAVLDGDLKRLKKQEQDIRRDLSQYTKSLDAIRDLESALEKARLKLELVQKSAGTARSEKELRKKLIERVEEARKAHDQLNDPSMSFAAPVTKADADLEKAQSVSIRAEKKRKEAESLMDLCRADSTYFNNKLHLDQLRERKGRIDRAREDAALADDLLAKNRVDDNTLKIIQKAEMLLITARAKLQTGAPNVLLRGLSDIDIEVDGEQSKIAKDEERRLPVSDRVRVTIPGAVDMEVTAGSSAADLAKKVEEARRKLEAACRDAGVGNPDEAATAHEERKEAIRRLGDKKRIELDDLRDLTYGQVAEMIIGLGKSVPAYPDSRVQEPKLPPDLESAKEEQRVAEIVLNEANVAWEEARAAVEVARVLREKLSERHQKVTIEIAVNAAGLKRAEDELGRSRNSASDDDIESKLLEFNEAVRTEEENVKSAEAALAGMEPDRIKALAETAEGSLQTVSESREAAQKEDTEVRARLKLLGEDGLQEKLDAARSRLEHIRQANEALIRRASAAMLLYVTMKEERDKMRRAYVAPLKERIERLGRLVFNNSFAVEVTEELVIANRTLDGSTVPFDSLSGGTKEQLSLISRLACAMTVAKEGGAPLVLDDALGYTDPDRLKTMGAVLAKAAQECQIIILTCVPDRYSNVGQATVVRLG